jgi:glutaredoxin
MLTIDIYVTPTCGSCEPAFSKTFELVEEIKKELGQVIVVNRIDITQNENHKKALKFEVKSVPTLVVGGEDVVRGVPNKEELLRLARKHLSKDMSKAV